MESVQSGDNCLNMYSRLNVIYDDDKSYLSSDSFSIKSKDNTNETSYKTSLAFYTPPEYQSNKSIHSHVFKSLFHTKSFLVSLQEPSCSKYSVGHNDYINTSDSTNTNGLLSEEQTFKQIKKTNDYTNDYTKQPLISLQKPSCSTYSANIITPTNIKPLSETIHNNVTDLLSYTKQPLVSSQESSCSKYSVSHSDYINNTNPVNIEPVSKTIHKNMYNSLSVTSGTYNLDATTDYTQFDQRWVRQKDLDKLLQMELNSKLLPYEWKNIMMKLDKNILNLKSVIKFKPNEKKKKGSRNVSDILQNIDGIFKRIDRKSIICKPKSYTLDAALFDYVDDTAKLTELSDDVDHVNRMLGTIKSQLKNYQKEKEEQRNSVNNHCDILKYKNSFGETSCLLEPQSNSSTDSSDHMREKQSTSNALLLMSPNKNIINLHESFCAQPYLQSYNLDFAADNKFNDTFDITTTINNDLPYKNLKLTENEDFNALSMHDEQMDYSDCLLASVKSQIISNKVVDEQRNSVDNHCDILKNKSNKKLFGGLSCLLGPQSSNGNDLSDDMSKKPSSLNAFLPASTPNKNVINFNEKFWAQSTPLSKSFDLAADKKIEDYFDTFTSITNSPYKKMKLAAPTENEDCNALNMRNAQMDYVDRSPASVKSQLINDKVVEEQMNSVDIHCDILKNKYSKTLFGSTSCLLEPQSNKGNDSFEHMREKQNTCTMSPIKSNTNGFESLSANHSSQPSSGSTSSLRSLTNNTFLLHSSDHPKEKNVSHELIYKNKSFAILDDNDNNNISDHNNMSYNDSNNHEASLDNHRFQITADKQNEESFYTSDKSVTHSPYKKLSLDALTVDINSSDILHEKNDSGEMVDKHRYSLRTCRKQTDHYFAPIPNSYLKKKSARKTAITDLLVCKRKGKNQTIMQFKISSISTCNTKNFIKKICPVINSYKFDGNSQNDTFNPSSPKLIVTTKPCPCGICPSQVPSTWSDSMHDSIHQNLNKLKFTVQAGMEIISNVNNNVFLYDIIKINGNSANKQFQSILKNINDFIDIEMDFQKENRRHSIYSIFLAVIPNTKIIGYLEIETLNRAISYKNNKQISNNLIPVKFGVAKLWVNVMYRNNGVASKLLKQFCNENNLKTNDIAFAHFGSQEIAFVKKFYKNERVLIY